MGNFFRPIVYYLHAAVYFWPATTFLSDGGHHGSNPVGTEVLRTLREFVGAGDRERRNILFPMCAEDAGIAQGG